MEDYRNSSDTNNNATPDSVILLECFLEMDISISDSFNNFSLLL